MRALSSAFQAMLVVWSMDQESVASVGDQNHTQNLCFPRAGQPLTQSFHDTLAVNDSLIMCHVPNPLTIIFSRGLKCHTLALSCGLWNALASRLRE